MLVICLKSLCFYLIKSIKFHKSLMIQLRDAMLSIHSSWAAAAWNKIHQSANLLRSKLSPQDESLLRGLSSTSASLTWQILLCAAGWHGASRNCSASTRGVLTPAQTRGRQLGLDSLQDGCNWSRLKKIWHKVPALRQCSKSLIVISVRHTVSRVHCTQV